MKRLLVGLDPGVSTGLAAWDLSGRRLDVVSTVLIHQAMRQVECWATTPGLLAGVIFEDARQRTWFAAADGCAERCGSPSRLQATSPASLTWRHCCARCGGQVLCQGHCPARAGARPSQRSATCPPQHAAMLAKFGPSHSPRARRTSVSFPESPHRGPGALLPTG